MRLIKFFSITVLMTSTVDVTPSVTIHSCESSTWHMSHKMDSPAIGVPLRSSLDEFSSDNPLNRFFRALR